jgi:homoserine kinase type II
MSSREHASVRAALSAWALAEPLELLEVKGGATHRVYRVTGPGGARFLRVYKRPDPALAAREHALIGHVRRRGLPVVLPVEARGGETVVAHDGAVYALYEAAPGVQVAGADISPRRAQAAGELLARLHAVLRALPDVGYVRWQLAWDGPEWIERLNVVERALLARGPENENDLWALRRLRAQRLWLAEAACPQTYEPSWSPQLIHGDYQDANLFFEGEVVSAVIDWDQAAIMPRAYEVARACGFMFRLARAPTRAFIDAYVAVSGMTPAELTDGARAWGCFADHHVWPLEEVYLHGNERARHYIPHVPFRPFLQAWSEIWK